LQLINQSFLGRCGALTAPDNGNIDCSSEDECSFTCNDGFVISGSTVRTCQDDNTWSGIHPTCIRGKYNDYEMSTRYVHAHNCVLVCNMKKGIT